MVAVVARRLQVEKEVTSERAACMRTLLLSAFIR
jgi:hypothetical protein